MKVESKFKSVSPLPAHLLNVAKQSYVTRHVKRDVMQTLVNNKTVPQSGDLVLAKVDRIRMHQRIELISGRRSRLFVDDWVILAYGNRYAPDQFESLIPTGLMPCHMVAGGGIASEMIQKSPKVKPATEIIPIGLIGDANGDVLNIKDFVTEPVSIHKANIFQVLSVGSSMNSGKTTTAAHLIKGFVADGFKVAGLKITGTGSGCDLWHFMDAGADIAIDFTDAGFATTYLLSKQQLLDCYFHLYTQAVNSGVDVIVMEIADGILQAETKMLLESEAIKSNTHATFYSAFDSCSAAYGARDLAHMGYQLTGVSGVVSSNPLNKRETENVLGDESAVLTKEQILSPGFGNQLFTQYQDTHKAVQST